MTNLRSYLHTCKRNLQEQLAIPGTHLEHANHHIAALHGILRSINKLFQLFRGNYWGKDPLKIGADDQLYTILDDIRRVRNGYRHGREQIVTQMDTLLDWMEQSSAVVLGLTQPQQQRTATLPFLDARHQQVPRHYETQEEQQQQQQRQQEAPNP